MILRETKHFIVEQYTTPIKKLMRYRIKAKNQVLPKTVRIRSRQDWEYYLKGLSDREFNGACIFDFGVGIFSV